MLTTIHPRSMQGINVIQIQTLANAGDHSTVIMPTMIKGINAKLIQDKKYMTTVGESEVFQ